MTTPNRIHNFPTPRHRNDHGKENKKERIVPCLGNLRQRQFLLLLLLLNLR